MPGLEDIFLPTPFPDLDSLCLTLQSETATFFLNLIPSPCSKRQTMDKSQCGFFDFSYASPFLPPSNIWLI